MFDCNITATFSCLHPSHLSSHCYLHLSLSDIFGLNEYISSSRCLQMQQLYPTAATDWVFSPHVSCSEHWRESMFCSWLIFLSVGRSVTASVKTATSQLWDGSSRSFAHTLMFPLGWKADNFTHPLTFIQLLHHPCMGCTC